MRFTKLQAAMFRNEISFVHMASSQERMDRAFRDFVGELASMGTYYTLTASEVWRMNRDSTMTHAYFRYCTPTPASVDHVPVLFMDGKKSEWSIPKLYDDCKAIPVEKNGLGPMVVR
jgi:hypothetical protein